MAHAIVDMWKRGQVKPTEPDPYEENEMHSEETSEIPEVNSEETSIIQENEMNTEERNNTQENEMNSKKEDHNQEKDKHLPINCEKTFKKESTNLIKAISPISIIQNIRKLKSDVKIKMQKCNNQQSQDEIIKNYYHLTWFVENIIAKLERCSNKRMNYTHEEDNPEIVQKLANSVIDLDIILNNKMKSVYEHKLNMKEYFALAQIIEGSLSTFKWIF